MMQKLPGHASPTPHLLGKGVQPPAASPERNPRPHFQVRWRCWSTRLACVAQVEVTAHEASPAGGRGGGVEEWRVLRFNGVTRQSVARLHMAPAALLAAPATAGIGGDSSSRSSGGDGSAAEGSTAAAATAGPEHQAVLVADPGCLAFEYTKSIVSAGELRRSALTFRTWLVPRRRAAA